MEEAYNSQLPDPWDKESALTQCLLVDADVQGKCRFHLYDPWHSFHLGIGKSYAASGMLVLQELLEGSSIDERISVLSSAYRDYCRRTKTTPVISKLDKYSFGGGGSNEANGTWNKACVTSNIMMFLEDFFERNPDIPSQREELRIFVSRLSMESFDG